MVVLPGMINVVLKLLGGSLIWEDYCFFQFPGENGTRAFKVAGKQVHQLIGSKNVYFSWMFVIFF